MNLQQHILEWLDSIGADGLLGFLGNSEREEHFDIDDLASAIDIYGAENLVPAYRHADGTWHTEPKHWFLCKTCICDCMPIGDDACSARFDANECTPYQSWLSHKGEAK